MNVARYFSLTRSFLERAKDLFVQNVEAAKTLHEPLAKLTKLYEN